MSLINKTAGVSLVSLIFLAVMAPAESGIFDEAQTTHGQAVFHGKCGACHGDDLNGGSESPALSGDAFWASWNQKTARNLYSRIISTMPPDGPGTLSETDVIDIVAYIIHTSGKVPFGSAKIQTANELNRIKLERPE
jgi:mono/diheme cytochrome c family protein